MLKTPFPSRFHFGYFGQCLLGMFLTKTMALTPGHFFGGGSRTGAARDQGGQ